MVEQKMVALGGSRLFTLNIAQESEGWGFCERAAGV